MPLYLLHAFRWPRSQIRIHIIIHNLEDCAADWLMGESGQTLASSLHTLHPTLAQQGISIKIFEQYDAADESRHTEDFAFVACEWHELGALSGRVEASVVTKASTEEAFEALRKELAPSEETDWWAVWCGDVRRGVGEATKETQTSPVLSSPGWGEKKGIRTWMKNIVLSPGRTANGGAPKDKFSVEEISRERTTK
ncbi:MAG: hypothetical protein M1813_008371 [Trichoglossum hirsutum]|nr:MAG: hypothetical protein M1813_008371 [Trichoglossum hirsutum]